jgi:hypothetical protein
MPFVLFIYLFVCWGLGGISDNSVARKSWLVFQRVRCINLLYHSSTCKRVLFLIMNAGGLCCFAAIIDVWDIGPH